MKRVGLFAMVMAVALAASVGGAATVSADPTNAKNAEVVELECTNGITGTLEVVTNGNGMWTPGHVVGSNQKLIPYSFQFTETFTPSGGGSPEINTETITKNAPRNGRLAVCAFGDSIQIPEGTLEFTGVVGVSYTPAK